jgi:hypothetical protein
MAAPVKQATAPKSAVQLPKLLVTVAVNTNPDVPQWTLRRV